MGRNPRLFKLVLLALFVALDVVVSAYLTIRVTPSIKVGASFLPVAFIGMLFGPIGGALGAAAGDMLQFLLVPGGVFNPGVTLSAALSGLAYGLLLYRRAHSLWRVAAAVAVCELIISALLTTAFLALMFHMRYVDLLLPRLLKSAVMTPIETAVLYPLWRLAKKTGVFQ